VKAMTFIAGAAVGYVLGTKAGRERYEQIVSGARNLKEQPVVAQAQARAKEFVDTGTKAVKSKLGADDDRALPGDLSMAAAGQTRAQRTPASTSSPATSQL